MRKAARCRCSSILDEALAFLFQHLGANVKRKALSLMNDNSIMELLCRLKVNAKPDFWGVWRQGMASRGLNDIVTVYYSMLTNLIDR